MLDFAASVVRVSRAQGGRVSRLLRIWGLWIVVSGASSGLVWAQEGYTFTASLAGGFAGSFDADGARDYDHPAIQAAFGMFTNDRTLTMVRIGRISFDSDQPFAGRLDAEIEYANVAGEYRFKQAAYDFGLYLGLGSYRLSGAGRDSESALGTVLGFTGDFDLTRRLSVVAEFDVHYVFFDDANLYGAALVGLAAHF